jgi:hypothetical protein
MTKIVMVLLCFVILPLVVVVVVVVVIVGGQQAKVCCKSLAILVKTLCPNCSQWFCPSCVEEVSHVDLCTHVLFFRCITAS